MAAVRIFVIISGKFKVLVVEICARGHAHKHITK